MKMNFRTDDALMTFDEFVKACKDSGYCSVAVAEQYRKQTGKETFDPNDFIRVFYMSEDKAHRAGGAWGNHARPKGW